MSQPDGVKTPPKPAKKSRELLFRVASAAVLIPVVLGIIWFGSWPFLLLLSVGVAFLSIEWGSMAAPHMPSRMAVAITMAVLSAVFTVYLSNILAGIAVLSFGTVCAGLYFRRLKGPYLDAAYGAFYIGWPALVLIWLRETHNGTYWVFFAFLIAWAADSAAYMFGKLIGGPKLWAKYSPNKTWAGFAGGMIAGMLTSGALADLTDLFQSNTAALIVGLLVAFATMGGDLWESMLKRRYGVKDSGALIPGHGGLLDRVDGLMFAIVAIGGIRWLVMLGTKL
ncbi:phosphatidate cytidylyltransferase [Asticcacaulis sp. BYS171W]|uniref:Phosphatidate cytidylyltransferase n=1 Tax=Asticcacaulis aquaticus TaxID=2984212 RepID=A0ABT5HP71_9CAUL|nr:phosphatidate cytidylyltransferase [Asticcacaulis aquaticus]MDC7681859.1 phosphatidate cytidylyltransferase [Asticcacaulis aquaticus]